LRRSSRADIERSPTRGRDQQPGIHRVIRIQDRDEPEFWESLGYHNRGDQWQEERYSGD
jgi:DMSO/TMAO reductase YedYZ molybdopterin-dependent catalytic subunit